MNRKTKKIVFGIILAVGGLLGLLLSVYIISNLLWTEPPDITYYFINSSGRIVVLHLYDNRENVKWVCYVAE